MTIKRCGMICLALLVLLPVLVEAADVHTRGIPDLPSADMRLSWEDFRQLLELSLELERERERMAKDQSLQEIEEELPAETPWAIVKAVYDADATHGDTVLIQARLGLYVWEKGWVQIPLFGIDVGLESVLLNEKQVPVVLKDNRHVLPINETGEHLVEVVFSVRAPLKDGVAQLTFDGPEATQSHMKLHLPASDAQVTASDATRITQTPQEDTLDAELVFRRGLRINVQWTIPAALPPPVEPEPDTPPVPVEPPRFTVAASTLAKVTETHAACETQLQIDLLRGALDGFEIVMPAGVQLLKVEGKGASWRAETENTDQRVVVALNHEVGDHYDLSLFYEAIIAPGTATLALPRLQIVNAARHTGFVAVITQGNVEVNLHEEMEGLRRIDASDLPAALTERADRPVLHAFHYADEGHLLVLSYRRMQDVAVRVAGIDRALVRSVITEEGLVITHAKYLVRNNLKQFLEVDIGADAEVWTAQVNNKPVRPARNMDDAKGEANSNNTVLLPLIKSQEGDVDRGAFPVEIIYMQRREPLQPGSNILPLNAPTTDLLVNLIEWEVLTPEPYRVLNAESDLRQVVQSMPWFENLARTYEGNYSVIGNRIRIGEGEKTHFATLYRLRHGVERFMITDINNPGASAQASSVANYDGRKRDALPDLSLPPTAAATVAGALPVPFTMPETGRPLHFERVVLPQKTPVALTLELEMIPHRAAWLLVLAGGALVWGVVLIALVSAFYKGQARRYVYLLLTLLSCAALCIGVLLLDAAVQPLLRNVIVAAGLGFAVPLLPWAVTRITGGQRHD